MSAQYDLPPAEMARALRSNAQDNLDLAKKKSRSQDEWIRKDAPKSERTARRLNAMAMLCDMSTAATYGGVQMRGLDDASQPKAVEDLVVAQIEAEHVRFKGAVTKPDVYQPDDVAAMRARVDWMRKVGRPRDASGFSLDEIDRLLLTVEAKTPPLVVEHGDLPPSQVEAFQGSDAAVRRAVLRGLISSEPWDDKEIDAFWMNASNGQRAWLVEKTVAIAEEIADATQGWLVQFTDDGGDNRYAMVAAIDAEEAAILAHEALFDPAEGEESDPWGLIGPARVLRAFAGTRGAIVKMDEKVWTEIPVAWLAERILERRGHTTNNDPTP